MAHSRNIKNADRDRLLEAACAAVCDAVADIGFASSWRVRLRAAELLIGQLTQTEPNVQVVRAVVYGRSAAWRLRGGPIPSFRDQVGPAMLVLGTDDERHAVLVVSGTVLMELASWNDHDDPGVLIRPFVHSLPANCGPRIVVDGASSGATLVYQFNPSATLDPLNRTYEHLARQLARAAAPRVRWSLDSPYAKKEASA